MTAQPRKSVPGTVLRVDPHPGEAWPGYLRRVADAYSCHPALIVEPVSPRWAQRLRRRTSACTAGIAMLPTTAQAIADRLNLEPTEVQAMQVAAHDGLTTTMSPQTAARFDPVSGTARAADLRQLGWVGAPIRARWCIRCERDTPGVDPLRWTYPWAVLCPRHELPLMPLDQRAAFHLLPEELERLLTTQQFLEDILTGTERFSRLPVREGFAELAAATQVLAARRWATRFSTLLFWEVHFVADVLPLAMTAVETPIDEWPLDLKDVVDTQPRRAFLVRALQEHGASTPFGLRGDLARHVEEPGHLLQPWAWEITLPASERRLITPQRRLAVLEKLPSMLPEDVAVPALTDFSPWLPVHQTRIAGAMAAYMLTTDGTLKEACDALGWTSTHQVPLRRLWWHLESVGQFPQYLEAVRYAVATLMGDEQQGRRRAGSAPGYWVDGEEAGNSVRCRCSGLRAAHLRGDECHDAGLGAW